MKSIQLSFAVIFFIFIIPTAAKAQTLYFPPVSGSSWDTVSPVSLGWCQDKIDTLTQFLEDKNTKAFIVLKDGQIAIEHYFGTFTQDSIWYWASAGKSLTAFLTGIAQEDGILNIDDTVSNYLGSGWTSCSSIDEQKILIVDQLSMTTGFDDQVPDPDCTDPACLNCIASPGTRWAYHNAPYHLMHDVIENASGQTWNQYTYSKLGSQTGITGAWVDHIFYSKARAMARFGLLMQANGNWNNTPILSDTTYFAQMVNSSQSLNLSYGYLWWLNGKSSFMLPGFQAVFPGSLIPNAPPDMIAALGKYDQKIYVVPSLGLTVIRMGESAGAPVFALSTFDNDLWAKLNDVFCGTLAIYENEKSDVITIYPNPSNGKFTLRGLNPENKFNIVFFDQFGRRVLESHVKNSEIDASRLSGGIYSAFISESGFLLPVRNKVVIVK